MVHFTEINQAPSPYSMLQHIGRVATLKLVPGHCLRYLQTTLTMRGEELVSEFMRGIEGIAHSHTSRVHRSVNILLMVNIKPI